MSKAEIGSMGDYVRLDPERAGRELAEALRKSAAGIWLVWIYDKDDEDEAILGIAGIFDNEAAARACESATVNVPYNERREAERFGVQSQYEGERRMC